MTDERERGWTRYPSAVTPDDPIRPEDVATIPAVYRRTIARWIAEQGARVAGPRAAQWVGEQHQTGYLSAVAGIATDLVDPLSEDSSISHQLETLSGLISRDELDALAFRRDFPAQRPATPVGHVLYPPSAPVPGPLDAPSVVERPAHPVVVDATTLDEAAAGRKTLLCETCGRNVTAFPCGPAHATAARLYAARPNDPAAAWLLDRES